MNKDLVIKGARLVLEGLGVDLNDHNFKTTPERYAKMLSELFEPKETGWPVFDEDYTDVVLLRKHKLVTLCPHHLAAVKLTASVAYIPNGKVIGASKLARIMHECNRMPMTQEALTSAILTKLREMTSFTSRGEAIIIEGEHDCFRIRGIRSDATMITYKWSGEFETDIEQQTRFLSLVRGGS